MTDAEKITKLHVMVAGLLNSVEILSYKAEPESPIKRLIKRTKEELAEIELPDLPK